MVNVQRPKRKRKPVIPFYTERIKTSKHSPPTPSKQNTNMANVKDRPQRNSNLVSSSKNKTIINKRERKQEASRTNDKKAQLNNRPHKSKKIMDDDQTPKKKITKTPIKSKKVASTVKNENKKPIVSNKKKKKQAKTISNGKEALQEALIRLHSSSVPETLPCREYQFDDIYNFVSRKLLEDQDGGCMYISGVPGTGKTATLREVKEKLCQERNLPKFKFIEINGLKLAQPNRFCSHFLMELDGIKKSNYQATEILKEKFSNPKIKKDFVILFIDELDYLKTKKQDILYHIFDWPNRKNSKLIVLAVANSMDLPERFLVNRVSSRLGLTRLLFQPYSYKELEQIVQSRLADDYLTGFEIFEPDALELICRKVSAVSGDARRVLDICRRAVEIAITDSCDKVTMDKVDKALKEIFHSIKNKRIMQASLQEQVFLRAFLQNFRSNGLEEYQFIEIFKTHTDICRFEGHYVPNTIELSKVANNLDLSKIILLERSHSHLYRRIRLNVSPDDIAFALNID